NLSPRLEHSSNVIHHPSWQQTPCSLPKISINLASRHAFCSRPRRKTVLRRPRRVLAFHFPHCSRNCAWGSATALPGLVTPSWGLMAAVPPILGRSLMHTPF